MLGEKGCDMNKGRMTAAVLGGVVSLLTLQSALAMGLDRSSRGEGQIMTILSEPARTPIAYLMFCVKSPVECRKDSARVADYTPDLALLINEVNERVNRAIKPQYDEGDVWSLNPTFGDCEDYALSKRQALIAKGVPAGALRVSIVLTERNERHAVLIVRTNIGDLVMDNRRSSVRARQKTGYQFVKMATENPLKWVK